MQYRLGSFRPPLDWGYFMRLWHARIRQAPDRRIRMTEVVQAWRNRPDRDFTDLRAVLSPVDPDHAWVPEAHDALRRVEHQGLEVRMLACEFEPGPDGYLLLAANAPAARLEVTPRDHLQIGFAAKRVGGNRVRVWPRLLREVCVNGALVSLSDLDEEVGEAGVGEAIDRAFSAARYEPVLERLREMRQIKVRRPDAIFDDVPRVRALEDPVERIRGAFHEGGDSSAYGLLNAITSTARDLPDWLEAFAGRYVWRVRPRPVPAGAVLRETSLIG